MNRLITFISSCFIVHNVLAVTAAETGAIQVSVESPLVTVSYALPIDCTSLNPATKDCEMEAKTDTTDTEEVKRKLYYTIGGVRLKFNFNLDSLTVQEKNSTPKYSWTFSRAGRSCPSFVQKKDNSNCTVQAANAEIKDKTILWWEPNDWASPSSTDVTLKVTFSAASAADGSTVNLPEKKIRMRLQSRTLKAVADTEDPFNGSDVKMLEQMLWQLGMSPSTEKGTAATRLDTAKRKKFLTGNPSVGRMVGRFNYSNYSYVADKVVHGVASITTAMNTGTVNGQSVIQKLGQHWLHYLMAYQNNSTTSQFKYSNLASTDVDNAVAVFDGGSFGYSSLYATSTATFTILPTYTATKHTDLTAYKSDFKRSDILKAMASREASGIHWGQGSNSHRISVGSGDELGSKGFNQIQNAYTYGTLSGQGNQRLGSYCGAVTAYTTGGASMANHYDPAENLKAKALFLTYKQGDCNRGFYLAFAQNSFTAPLDKNGLTLKAMKTGTKIETITSTHTDDTYEILSKGIGAYNQGHTAFDKTDSWAELLVSQSHAGTGKTAAAMNYALDTLHTVSRGIGLPYRQYIWQGGMYPANLTDAAGNPDPRAGTAWCFGYGEQEWLNPGFQVQNPANPLERIGARYQDYFDRADNNDAYKMACE